MEGGATARVVTGILTADTARAKLSFVRTASVGIVIEFFEKHMAYAVEAWIGLDDFGVDYSVVFMDALGHGGNVGTSRGKLEHYKNANSLP